MGFLNKFIAFPINDESEASSNGSNKKGNAILKGEIDLSKETAQEFIPFNDIESSMICMDDARYRMVVEVGSVNYDLKTQEERVRIEQQFRVAISGWDFPFALYTQTREVDNRTILATMRNDALKVAERYPYLAEYANDYTKAYAATTQISASNLTKRHFVIVNCDDAKAIKSNKNETDYRDYAFNKLSSAVTKVMSSLNAMQLEVHCLNTKELAELLFSAINKKEGEIIDGIGEFMSDIVEGENDYKTLNREKLRSLFDGFENQLKVEFFNNHNYSPEDFAKAQRLLNQLDIWRDEVLEVSLTSEDEGYFDLSL